MFICAGSEILTQVKDHNLNTVEIPITARYDISGTSSKHPVAHGVGVFFGILLLQQYNQTRYFSLAYAMLVSLFMILGAIGLFMGIRDELRITNVGFGKLSTNICPLIESEEVVRLRAADGI